MNRGNKAEYSGNEKWQKFKKEFWGKKLLATTEWGLIDFDPQGKDDMVRGDALSYDEYLDLQMQSGKRVRTYFEICYYDADFFSFKGRIKRINTKETASMFRKDLCRRPLWRRRRFFRKGRPCLDVAYWF